MRSPALALLRRWFGPPEEGRGLWGFYSDSWSFKCGAKLAFHHVAAEGILIEIPGAVCDSLGLESSLALARELFDLDPSVRCTRTDGAIDEAGTRAGLVDGWRQALQDDHRQLCLARSWGLDERRSRGKASGRMVTLGTRGDGGSGRYGRVYDKGLETKLAAPGEWERFEVEFTGSVADQVLRALVKSATPERDLAERVLGAFDLRAVTGRRELDLRPRLPFWSHFIHRVTSGSSVLVRGQPVRSSLAGWVRWVRQSVVPTAAAVCSVLGVAGTDLAKMLDALGETWRPQAREGLVLAELRSFLEEGGTVET